MPIQISGDCWGCISETSAEPHGVTAQELIRILCSNRLIPGVILENIEENSDIFFFLLGIALCFRLR
jgi:hypothetical protein